MASEELNRASEAQMAGAPRAVDPGTPEEIDAYIDEVWEQLVSDIAELVSIPSIEDMAHAEPGAPFGPEPARALKAGVALAERLGFEAHECDGYIAYADLPGESNTQIGIIGHLDVVPVGTGWNYDPFTLTRKDGYLIGRGVWDDKGPTVTALYAMHYFKRRGITLPCTLRALLGANEETGMRDVAYYRERFADPAFIFTPDADFPVGYGEKGHLNGVFTSAPLGEDARLVAYEGGVALNAVPSLAHAVVRVEGDAAACVAALPEAERVQASVAGEGLVRLDASGVGGHASMPEGTVNAIGELASYLIENDLCSDGERAFLSMALDLLHAPDGSGLGIATSDADFGPLTAIGGTANLADGRLTQTIDIRFPTSTSCAALTEALSAHAQEADGTFECTRSEEPFITAPDSPMIQALCSAFNEATGRDERPFTMGGGTYARHFTSAASFGPNQPWVERPAWAGGEHAADEAISENMLREALKIYILTIARLMEVKF